MRCAQKPMVREEEAKKKIRRSLSLSLPLLTQARPVQVVVDGVEVVDVEDDGGGHWEGACARGAPREKKTKRDGAEQRAECALEEVRAKQFAQKRIHLWGGTPAAAALNPRLDTGPRGRALPSHTHVHQELIL